MSQTNASPTSDPVTLSSAKGRALVAALLALAVVAGTAAATRWPADPRRFAFASATAQFVIANLHDDYYSHFDHNSHFSYCLFL